MTLLTRHDIAAKLHVTASPQHCQHLAPEVGKGCCGKSPYLAYAEARSKAAVRIWTRIAARACTDDWAYGQRTKQPAQDGEGIHPAASNSLEDFKDRKVDGLQLCGLLQAAPDPSQGWHLINAPPPPSCVEVLQWEVETVGGIAGYWLCWWQRQLKSSSVVTPCPCWHSPRVEIRLLS